MVNTVDGRWKHWSCRNCYSSTAAESRVQTRNEEQEQVIGGLQCLERRVDSRVFFLVDKTARDDVLCVCEHPPGTRLQLAHGEGTL